MKIILIFLLLNSSCISQQKVEISAAEELLNRIEIIEKELIEFNNAVSYQIVNEIVCVTQIYPEKWDGTYVGVVYYPTLDEIKFWKNWVESNKAKIQFMPNTTIIMFEYEKDKFRYSNCKL